MTADLVLPLPEEFLDHKSSGEGAPYQSDANLAELVFLDHGAKRLLYRREPQVQCSVGRVRLILSMWGLNDS
jgi:hypothetical protein